MEPCRPAPCEWDTFGLFEWLLGDFENLLSKSLRVVSSKPPAMLQVHLAVVGFLLFRSKEDWGAEQYRVVRDYLEGDFSLEALDWYEEAAAAVQMFACLAFGALLGKHAGDEINDVGYMLGEAHLTAFLSLNQEVIHARYEAWQRFGNGMRD